MTWTTAAGVTVGTAQRMARWVDRRPTPTAMGANRAAEIAITANQNVTLSLAGAEASQDVDGGLLQDIGVVEHGSEGG